jgi:hypothetical protein
MTTIVGEALLKAVQMLAEFIKALQLKTQQIKTQQIKTQQRQRPGTSPPFFPPGSVFRSNQVQYPPIVNIIVIQNGVRVPEQQRRNQVVARNSDRLTAMAYEAYLDSMRKTPSVQPQNSQRPPSTSRPNGPSTARDILAEPRSSSKAVDKTRTTPRRAPFGTRDPKEQAGPPSAELKKGDRFVDGRTKRPTVFHGTVPSETASRPASAQQTKVTRGRPAPSQRVQPNVVQRSQPSGSSAGTNRPVTVTKPNVRPGKPDPIRVQAKVVPRVQSGPSPQRSGVSTTRPGSPSTAGRQLALPHGFGAQPKK